MASNDTAPDFARGLRGFARRVRAARRHGSSVAGRVPTLSFARRYLAWRARCAFGPSVAHDGPDRATAVLLSFARPWNLGPIVDALARCDFLERVLVVNNHPDVRVAEWVRARDPRVRASDAGAARPPLSRFEAARADGGERFVFVDDDLFLSPRQVLALFRRLIEDPSVPHGMYGQRLLPAASAEAGPAFENRVHGEETRVDVLNRAYFVTRDHVDRMWRLHDLAKREDPDLDLGFMDDLLISLAAPDRPRLHDVGLFLDCPSQGDPRVAVWARHGNGGERLRVLRRLLALRGRVGTDG